MIKCEQVGTLKGKGHNDMNGRVYSDSGLSSSIRANSGGHNEIKIIEVNPIKETKVIGGIGEKNSNNGTQWSLQDGIYEGDTAISLTNYNPYYQVGSNYRIRKLTPKECFRLQDFDDEDVDKCVAAGISNSQLYKQAGNSIVVACLEAIFRELF